MNFKQKINTNVLLYINIPFCNYKCHYCSKVAHIPKKDLLNDTLHDSYVESLIKAIEHYYPFIVDNYNILGLNIGGGTPTILSAKNLKLVLSTLSKYLDFDKINVGVEATPETLSNEKLLVFKDFGVKRVSVGVQTFNDETLRKLGRPCNSKDIYNCANLLHKSYLVDWNLDLMISIPGETIDDSIDTVQRAVDIGPTHLTTYYFKPFPDTVLFRKLLRKRETIWNEQEHINVMKSIKPILEKKNYINYEFYHWSKNPSMWYFRDLDVHFAHKADVFGLGAGAQSYIAPFGNKMMNMDISGFMKDPLSFYDGKFGLEYSLERSLSSKFGLNYKAMSKMFGVSYDEIVNNKLVNLLKSVPGVKVLEDGLKMDQTQFLYESACGIPQYMNSCLRSVI